MSACNDNLVGTTGGGSFCVFIKSKSTKIEIKPQTLNESSDEFLNIAWNQNYTQKNTKHNKNQKKQNW
jgi:hypothetical protein